MAFMSNGIMEGSTKVKHILDFFKYPINDDELIDGDGETDELYSLCDDPMSTPVQLIDEQLKLVNSSHITNLLVENTGFLVVGVIGLQGSGKSSVLNLLGNQISPQSSLFDGPYATQQLQNLITNSPESIGVKLYITQDRIILLDTQPLASFALANYHIHKASSLPKNPPSVNGPPAAADSNGHRIAMPGGWAPEVWSEMASMQIVAFLLNVCHVLIVVSDKLDSSLIRLHRLVDCASGLRPTVYTPSAMSRPLLNSMPESTSDSHQHARRRSERRGQASVANGQVDSHSAKNQPAPDASDVGGGLERRSSSRQHEREDDIAYDGDEDEVMASRMDDIGVGGADELDDADIVEDRLTTTPSGLLRSRRAQQQQLFETEPSEVRESMSWLRGLTRYSASLVHVYNSAPAGAFLDPVVRDSLTKFYQRLLPRLYSWSLRQDYLIDIGPRLLAAHARLRGRTSQSHPGPPGGEVDAPDDETGSEVPGHHQEHRHHRQQKGLLRADPSSSLVTDPGTSEAGGGYTHSQSLPAPSDGTADRGFTDSQEQEGRESPPGREQMPRRASEPSLLATSVLEVAETGDSLVELIGVSQEAQRSVDGGSIDGAEGLQPATDSAQPTFAVPLPPPPLKEVDKCRISPPVARPTPDSEAARGPSHEKTERDVEAEIVTECCSVIRAVETDLHRHLVSGPGLVESGPPPPTDRHLRASPSPALLPGDLEAHPPPPGPVDGEEISARLAKMSHHVHAVRSRFFDPVRRWDLVRFFLLPELDHRGAAPLGCPSYADAAKFLQSAILSTPRQHMSPQMTEKKWFAYAENMWSVVCSSPLFSDYHQLLLNQIQ